MSRRIKAPSSNFCVICGRHTNDRRIIGDVLKNQYFICNTCEKVWCGSCMSQLMGQMQNKVLKLAKKGQVLCPDCNQFSPMVKSPETLRFTQSKAPQAQQPHDSENLKICSVCGQEIRDEAKFCEFCGSEQ